MEKTGELWSGFLRFLSGVRTRRILASAMVYCMIGTQILPSFASGGSGHSDPEGHGAETHTAANAGRDEAGGDDSRAETSGNISGTIKVMQDGSLDNPAMDLRIVINGVLSNIKPVVELASDSNAHMQNDEVPVIDDRGLEENGGADLPGQPGITVWRYNAVIPDYNAGFTYSVVDTSFLKSKASGSNLDEISFQSGSDWALFYAAEDGELIGEAGESLASGSDAWEAGAARHLIYVGKVSRSGEFRRDDQTANLPDKITLQISALEAEDEPYVTGVRGWIEPANETWIIQKALSYNPQTGSPIVLRAQAGDDYPLRYENIGDHEGDEEYIYADGTIVNYSLNCDAAGTVLWEDLSDAYRSRWTAAKLRENLKLYDAEGQPVNGEVNIEVDSDTNPDKWKFSIAQLTIGQTYTLKLEQVPTGYANPLPEDGLEFTANEGAILEPLNFILNTPVVVTINNQISGLGNGGGLPLTYNYKIFVDGAEYSGRYYLLDDAGQWLKDGNGNPIYGDGSSVALKMEQDGVRSLSLQLISGAENSEIRVEQGSVSGMMMIDNPEPNGLHTFTFYNTTMTNKQVQLYWNDNRNAAGIRPYADEEAYRAAGHLKLMAAFTGSGGQSEEFELTPANCDKLGLNDWDGFTVAKAGDGDSWFFESTLLPTHVLVENQGQWEFAEVSYKVDADKDEIKAKKYNTKVSQLEENGDIWKVLYTQLKDFQVNIKWYDDNQKNAVRPDSEAWMESVRLYVIDTSPEASQEEGEEAADYRTRMTVAAAEGNVSLDQTSKWSLTVTDLPAFDEDGYPCVYYVKQDTVAAEQTNHTLLSTVIKGGKCEGLRYESQYSNLGNYINREYGCFERGTIENTIKGETGFSAMVSWSDKAVTDKSKRPDVTLTLWRYTKGTNPVDPGDYDHSYFAGVQLDGSWKITGQDKLKDELTLVFADSENLLPLFDEDGHEYVYFVRENTGSSDYSYKKEFKNSGTYSDQKGSDKLLFHEGTLKYKLSDTIEIKGTKEWKAKAIEGMRADVKIELQRKLASDNSWSTIDAKILKEFTAEAIKKSFSFGSLPKYDEDGALYEYRVIETEVEIEYGDGREENKAIPLPGDNEMTYRVGKYQFEISYNENSKNGTEIINRLVGDVELQINKTWNTYDGETKAVHFHLFRDEVDICAEFNTKDPFVHDGCLVLTGNGEKGQKETWSETWKTIGGKSIPKYDSEGREYVYTIEEVVPDGYAAEVIMSYKFEDEDGNDYTTVIADVTNSNQPGGFGRAIWVKKEWLDDDHVLGRDDVTVYLLVPAEGNAEDYQGYETIEIPGQDGAEITYFIISKDTVLRPENGWMKKVSLMDIKKETPVYGMDYILWEASIGNAQRGTTDYELFQGIDYIQTDEYIYKTSMGTDQKYYGQTMKVIENVRVGTLTIEVNKLWKAGGDHSEYQAQFELLRDGTPLGGVEPIWVTGNGQAKFADLDKYDDEGKLYSYDIKEIAVIIDGIEYPVTGNRFTAAGISYQTNQAVRNAEKSYLSKTHHTGDLEVYEIVNRRSETQKLEFNKIWKDNGDTTRPDIYFRLWSKINDSEAKFVEAVPQVVRQGNGYHVVYTYYSMPMYNSEGYPYTYYADEGMPARYSGDWETIYYSEEYAGPKDNTVPIIEENGTAVIPVNGYAVNYRKDSLDLNGEKVWVKSKDLQKLFDNRYFPEVKILLEYAVKGSTGYGEWKPYMIDDGSGGLVQASQTLGGDRGNYYRFNFDDYPEYDALTGGKIRYRVQEQLTNGGETSIFEQLFDPIYFTLKNNYKPEKDLQISIEKTWKDQPLEGDQPVNGYPKATFTLRRVMQGWSAEAGGCVDLDYTKETVGTITFAATKTSDWKHTWSDLAYYAPTGYPYRYYLKETEITGYQLAEGENAQWRFDLGTDLATGSDGNYITATNQFKTDVVEIKGKKQWDKETDWRWETRPDDIKLSLWRSYTNNQGRTVEEQLDKAVIDWKQTDKTDKTLAAWSFEFKADPDQPFYRYTTNGQEYVYSVKEEKVPGYSETIRAGYQIVDGVKVYNITITNTLDRTNLKVEKKWDDESNKYGTRPVSVTVKLQRRLESGGTYEDVKRYDSATQTEEMVTLVIDTSGTGNTFSNSFTSLPLYQAHTLPLVKYQYRAVETAMTFADGTVVAITNMEDDDGIDSAGGGYTGQADKNSNQNKVKIANTLFTCEVEVVKQWQDLLPGYDRSAEIESVTFELQRRNEDGSYTVLKDAAGNDIIYVMPPSGTGHTFTKLPRYDRDGDEYSYRVAEREITLKKRDESNYNLVIHPVISAETEDSMAGVIGGYTFESTWEYAGGRGITTITNALPTRGITAQKLWDDAGNQDGKRPESVTLELQYDGKSYQPPNTVTLDGEAEVQGRPTVGYETQPWVAAWEGFPDKHADGTPYAYSVVEQQLDARLGYEDAVYGSSEEGVSVSESEEVILTVTNSRIPETISYSVIKFWDESEAGSEEWMEDIRPDSIQAQLLADGDACLPPNDQPAVLKGPAWSHTWTELPKYANETGSAIEPGETREIQYSVIEVWPEGEWGYDYLGSLATGTNADQLTNKLRTTELTIEKIWDDFDNIYERRTDTITVQLQRTTDENDWDGSDIGAPIVLEIAGQSDVFVISGLPVMNKQNEMYYYRVREVKMGNTMIRNGKALGYQVNYQDEVYALGQEQPGEVTIVNQLEREELTIAKRWVDQENRYETRPEALSLILKVDPEDALTAEQLTDIVLEGPQFAGNTWTYTYKNLPKYDMEGRTLVYFVEEEPVPGYITTYDEAHVEITNTLETIDLEGTKTWEDQSNRFGLRPAGIKLYFEANGEFMKSQPEINWTQTSDQWTWNVQGLPAKDKEGTAITYTLTEEPVAGYGDSIAGMAVTNRMRTGALSVLKKQNGGYATDITFRIDLTINGVVSRYTGAYKVLAEGEDISAAGEIRQTGDNGAIVIQRNQKFVITDLPSGVEYKVTEDSLSRYVLDSVTGDSGTIPNQGTAEAVFTNRYRSGGGGGGGGGGSSTSGPGVTVGGVEVIDEGDAPLGDMSVPIDDQGVPIGGLARTGDNSLPYVVLVVVMLAAAGIIIVIGYKKRKDSYKK